MPYALVQKSLDQKIDRKMLEEASTVAPSVARGDCARLARELFGIVVDQLPHNEAVALQRALARFGFATEVVPQQDLPLLTPVARRRGIRFQEGSFTAIDGMGREQTLPWDEVQFAAGGFLDLVRLRPANDLEWDQVPAGGGAIHRHVRVIRRQKAAKEREFRLELFLSCPPHRLQFPASSDSLLIFDQDRLRFHQTQGFLRLLQRVGCLLPADCLSLGIRAAVRQEEFTYPSPGAFDEEITWHLFQRLRAA